MSRKQKNRVGVIGLGQIGSKISAGLRAAGFSVYVWNRSPKAEPNFLGSAIEVADLCDTIQLFVPDDAALDAVVRTITAALRPRHVILAHAAVSPTTARELGTIVESAGARYLDAPFAGSRADAEARQLVYYIGGDEAAIKDARPVLQATARSIVPVGAIGDASLLKLALQAYTAVTLEGIAEMLSLVRAGGVKPEALLDAIEADPSRSPFVSAKLASMVKGNFEGGVPVRHLYRDLQLALKAAGTNPHLPATGAVAGLLFGAMKRGWAASDGAILSRVFEPDPPPVEIARKEEPVAAEIPPPAEPPVVEPAKLEEQSAEPPDDGAGEVIIINASHVSVAKTETPPAPPVEAAPAGENKIPVRRGMIPETHGGGSSILPRRGLELIHTTPVVVGIPKSATGRVPLSSPPPPPGAPATAMPNAPTVPPKPAERPIPWPTAPATPLRPAAGMTPGPGGFTRLSPTASVPIPPFPAASPASPNLTGGSPHRLARRLSDTTTNLQALLQSALGSGKPPAAAPSTTPTNSAIPTPVPPDLIGPAAPEKFAVRPIEEVVTPNPVPESASTIDEIPLEAIETEVLPPDPSDPVIAPVVPGDIRPTQRVPIRPNVRVDSSTGSRLIREQKAKNWLERLMGG